MTTIVEIDGVDIRSAPILNRDCAFPISNLARRCPKDEIFADMPIFYGGWEDGTVAPAFTGVTYTVTNQANCDPCAPASCRSPIVTMDLDGCELIAPDMACLSLSTPVLEWKDLLTRFCRQRQLARNGITIFGRDGNLDFSRPYTLNMTQMALQAVWATLARLLVDSTLAGDASAELQFDGLFTQLENGWAPASVDPCPPAFNVEQVVDWAILTGLATPGPDDVTIAGQTVTIWGTVYPVPAGLNFAEFLDDLWIEKIATEGICEGDVTEWEMFTAFGQAKCLINTAACLKPCSSCDDDPGARDRLRDWRAGKMVELYPSGVEFRIKQSRAMPANTIRFGPRTINDNPTYGLFIDDVDKYLMELPTDPFDRFMPMMGNDEPNFLCTDDWRNEIENRGMFWNLRAVGDKCVQGSAQICAGVLATARHLWLRVDNIYCGTLIGDCVDPIVIVP